MIVTNNSYTISEAWRGHTYSEVYRSGRTWFMGLAGSLFLFLDLADPMIGERACWECVGCALRSSHGFVIASLERFAINVASNLENKQNTEHLRGFLEIAHRIRYLQDHTMCSFTATSGLHRELRIFRTESVPVLPIVQLHQDISTLHPALSKASVLALPVCPSTYSELESSPIRDVLLQQLRRKR